jgi:hypothetical protein
MRILEQERIFFEYSGKYNWIGSAIPGYFRNFSHGTCVIKITQRFAPVLNSKKEQ